MKKLITGNLFIVCFFALVGWGWAPNNSTETDKGPKQAGQTDQKEVEKIEKLSEGNKGLEQADEKRQKNLEEIKRSRGEGSGIKNLHTFGSVSV